MCAPAVINAVRRDLSRRHLLGALIASVAATVATQERGYAQEKPVRLPKGFRNIYDLTHTVSEKFPVYPILKPMQILERHTIARDGFYTNELIFNEHTGTHMDGPIHFIANGNSADRIAVDRLFAPLAIVSIQTRTDKDADTTLTVDDLMAWEKRHGRLPRGAFVAMHSGWDARVGVGDRFLNRDAKGTQHSPGFSEAAAQFLVQERDIVGVGVDTLSLDAGAVQKFVAHLTLLGAGKYGIECMANLGTVPPAGAMLIVGGPKHQHASGGPVRAFAVA